MKDKVVRFGNKRFLNCICNRFLRGLLYVVVVTVFAIPAFIVLLK